MAIMGGNTTHPPSIIIINVMHADHLKYTTLLNHLTVEFYKSHWLSLMALVATQMARLAML